jgi:pimeloyl-ACP methyl ester carboxylesterase
MRSSVREKAVIMGSAKSLVGVLTSPETAAEKPDRPVVIILNAGIIHRVGPNRIHVLLARALADKGLTTLRFDLSGIGDSDPQADRCSLIAGVISDFRAAAEYLMTSRKASRFILVGLCAGADKALLIASGDPRVVGAVLIDQFAFKTPGYYVRHYGRRLFKIQSWINVAKGRNPLGQALRGRWRAAGVDGDGDGQISAFVAPHDPSKAWVKAALTYLVSRGVQLFCVFTRGLEGRYNYRSQFINTFSSVPFNGKLRLDYFPQADHTFSSERNKAKLVDAILQWVTEVEFAAGPTTGSREAPNGRPPPPRGRVPQSQDRRSTDYKKALH